VNSLDRSWIYPQGGTACYVLLSRYAVLLNNVPPDDKMVWCSEKNVEVIPLNNPVIMERLQIGFHMLKEHLVKDQLEEIESDLKQSAFLSETKRFNLPLKSVFIPNSPKIEMIDYQPPYDRRDPRREIPSGWNLNSGQINAAAQLLKFRFSMVVGPPGTGKTQTIVASSLFLTQFADSRVARLAILVPTHAAGDALVKTMTTFISKHGLKDRFLRLRSWNDAHTRLFCGNESNAEDG
jgi:AAA domain